MLFRTWQICEKVHSGQVEISTSIFQRFFNVFLIDAIWKPLKYRVESTSNRLRTRKRWKTWEIFDVEISTSIWPRKCPLAKFLPSLKFPLLKSMGLQWFILKIWEWVLGDYHSPGPLTFVSCVSCALLCFLWWKHAFAQS